MALNLPTFYKRTASAIVFAIIMLAGLLWNDWAFLGLICLIEVLCYKEYVALMKKIYPTAHWPGGLILSFSIIGVAVPLLAFLHMQGNIIPGYALKLSAAIPVLFFLCALLLRKEFLQALLLSFLGLLYITLPVVCLLHMHAVNFIIPLALILMIWTNDTMAYLVGSFIGKTPFSPISPKKTWEGTAGGAILTIIGAAVYAYFKGNHVLDFMALAFCAAVAGTLGDLVESKLKRLADIKDSGNIMPGHGGALDRFDSLLVATPFAFAYVACCVTVW